LYPSISGITMNLETFHFASRPVLISARRSLNLDETFYDSMVRRSGDELWRFLTQAMEVGDQIAIRRITQIFLLNQMKQPNKMERDRLILTAAAAQVDYHEVKFVRDLLVHLQKVRDEISIIRLTDATFGLRNSGASENPFSKAESRIDDSVSHVRQLIIGGNRNVTAHIVQGLSYLGDFPLADGIAHAMREFGESETAPAVLGAKYRHLHDRPDLAVQYVTRNTLSSSHSWSHNNLCGALCDVGDFKGGLWHVCHSLSLLTYGVTPKEIKERHFTGNTLWRPLRELGLEGQLMLGKQFSSLNKLGEHRSVDKTQMDAYRSAVISARLLKSLGMLELSRSVTRVIGSLPDDWVSHALVEIDQEEVVFEMVKSNGEVELIGRKF